MMGELIGFGIYYIFMLIVFHLALYAIGLVLMPFYYAYKEIVRLKDRIKAMVSLAVAAHAKSRASATRHA